MVLHACAPRRLPPQFNSDKVRISLCSCLRTSMCLRYGYCSLREHPPVRPISSLHILLIHYLLILEFPFLTYLQQSDVCLTSCRSWRKKRRYAISQSDSFTSVLWVCYIYEMHPQKFASCRGIEVDLPVFVRGALLMIFSSLMCTFVP